jgi:hypothetical protein
MQHAYSEVCSTSAVSNSHDTRVEYVTSFVIYKFHHVNYQNPFVIC